MAFEIEMKAHADASAKERIDRIAGAKGSPVLKEDLYFALPGDEAARFRIRLENGRLVITAKANNRRGGLECNEEVEVEHDAADRAKLVRMAELAGFEIFIEKRKEGWSWNHGPFHIELLDVKHLGWFLEIETFSDHEGFEANKALYDSIRNIMAEAGVPESAVEERPYQMLLRNMNQSAAEAR